MPKLIDRFRGIAKSVPAYKPGKFRSKPFRGATPLPISVVAEVWETEDLPSSPITRPPTSPHDEVEEPEPPFGEVEPGHTDLRKYLR
jgi:hypothetical protein